MQKSLFLSDSYSPTSHRRGGSKFSQDFDQETNILHDSHQKLENDHHFRTVKPSPLPPPDGGELTGLVSILADSVRRYAPDEAALALDTEALCMRVAEIESESKTLEQSIMELNSRVQDFHLVDEDEDDVYPTYQHGFRDVITLPGPSVEET